MASPRRINARVALKRAAIVAGAGLIGLIVITRFLEPSLDRDWVEACDVLPGATVTDTAAHVRNIRAFRYRGETDFDRRYYDDSFELARLVRADYVLVPFSTFRAGAHAFVSFEFDDGRRLAVSVEARKEKGEDYSALFGMFRQYELMYVVADEMDVIDLRVSVRNDRVFIYPVRAPAEKLRALFVSMLTRADRLTRAPEFYHTITNNCALNIVRHVNEITPNRIPYGYQLIFPAFSDRLALELGLIDTELDIAAARAKYDITAAAQAARGHPDYSRLIRM